LKLPRLEVVIGDDAVDRLGERVDRPALVVMDANTEEALGERVLAELRAAGVDAEALVFPERSGLLATPGEVERVQSRLGGGRLPVAVGAGVITDVVRYGAHRCGSDSISVPTAASMDG
jgi:glycerol-1-phosphate dehydrogenase [NAD(P)+]